MSDKNSSNEENSILETERASSESQLQGQLPHSNLIGRTVNINGGFYDGHWGTVKSFDGEYYTVSGGSLGDNCPIFSRDEFRVPRAKDYGTHRSHCYQDEYENSCKYGEKNCPARKVKHTK